MMNSSKLALLAALWLWLTTCCVVAQDCFSGCLSGIPEYRFNPTATSWEAHRVLAKQLGCELASISSEAEQAAALKAMEPYVGYPYHAQGFFESSFAFLGGRVMMDSSFNDPEAGTYTYEWIDGSGTLDIQRGINESEPFSNFIPGDPNGGTEAFGNEPYLALSLDENGSAGIPRGAWVDFGNFNSPALYKCCAPTQSSTFCGDKKFFFSPVEALWEDHQLFAREVGCELASIRSAEEQVAAEIAMEPYIGFPYEHTENFASSFVYMGGKLARDQSNPFAGDYTFEWVDGSSDLGVSRGFNRQFAPYSNFIPGDPNGGTTGFETEQYLALSLDENQSRNIRRGKWVDFGSSLSPALYQCRCRPIQPPNCKTDAPIPTAAPFAPTPAPVPTLAPTVPTTPAPVAPIPEIELIKLAGPPGLCNEANVDFSGDIIYVVPSISDEWAYCYVISVTVSSEECLEDIVLKDDSTLGVSATGVTVDLSGTTTPGQLCPGETVFVTGPVNDGADAPDGPWAATVTGTGLESGNDETDNDAAAVILATPAT